MKHYLINLGAATLLAGAAWASDEDELMQQWQDDESTRHHSQVSDLAQRALSDGTAESWWERAAMLSLLNDNEAAATLWQSLSEHALADNSLDKLRAMAIVTPYLAKRFSPGQQDVQPSIGQLTQQHHQVLTAWQALEPTNLAPSLMRGKPLGSAALAQFDYHDVGAFQLAATLQSHYPEALELPAMPGEPYRDDDLVWISVIGHSAAVSANFQGCGHRNSAVDENDPDRCLRLGKILAEGGTSAIDVAMGLALQEVWYEAHPDQDVPVELLERQLKVRTINDRFGFEPTDDDRLSLGQWQELTAQHGEWGAMQHLNQVCPAASTFAQCLQREPVLSTKAL